MKRQDKRRRLAIGNGGVQGPVPTMNDLEPFQLSLRYVFRCQLRSRATARIRVPGGARTEKRTLPRGMHTRKLPRATVEVFRRVWCACSPREPGRRVGGGRHRMSTLGRICAYSRFGASSGIRRNAWLRDRHSSANLVDGYQMSELGSKFWRAIEKRQTRPVLGGERWSRLPLFIGLGLWLPIDRTRGIGVFR